MILDSESLIEIKVTSSENRILGRSVAKVEKGIAIFDEIQFFGKPESKNNNFFIQTKAIDQNLIKKFYGEEFYESIEGIIKINFRGCVEGEEEQNNECHVCPTNFYSIEAHIPDCLACDLKAECKGGN